MSKAKSRTVSLAAEQASYIDALVKSGGYASASDVVSAGLRALQERDETVERWLKDEVVPVYDAMQADPARGRTSEQVGDRLHAHYLKHVTKAGRGA